mgnify:CR=1 FL=1
MRVEGMQSSNIDMVNKNTQGQGSYGVEKRTPTQKDMSEDVYYGKNEYTEEELIKAVDKANKSFEPFDRRLEFSIHEKTKQVMVKIINSTNDEVIRELPPEKILDLVAHMMEVAGLIIDAKA